MSEHVRQLVLNRIKELSLNMREVSISLGKNHAYIQQFIERGVPASLKEDVRDELAKILQVSADDLRSQPRLVLKPDTRTNLSERDTSLPVKPGQSFNLINYDLLRRSIAAACSIYEGKPSDPGKLARKAIQIYRNEEPDEATAREDELQGSGQ